MLPCKLTLPSFHLPRCLTASHLIPLDTSHHGYIKRVWAFYVTSTASKTGYCYSSSYLGLADGLVYPIPGRSSRSLVSVPSPACLSSPHSHIALFANLRGKVRPSLLNKLRIRLLKKLWASFFPSLPVSASSRIPMVWTQGGTFSLPPFRRTFFKTIPYPPCNEPRQGFPILHLSQPPSCLRSVPYF